MPERHSGVASPFSRLREWQQDGIIVASSVALGTMLYMFGLFPREETGGPGPSWVPPTLFGCICLAEVFRRKAPTIALIAGFVLVATDAFFGVSLPMWIVFADLLYAATLYGPRRVSRRMVPIAGMCIVFAVVAAYISLREWQSTILAVLASMPAIVVPVWWASNIRQHQKIAAAERTNAEQLEKIGELDREAAVSGERARMARDLHDVIAGHLSAIAIQSEAALSMKEGGAQGQGRTVLSSVREDSVRALKEMRTMIGVLRADGGDTDETTAPARLAELGELVESARGNGMRLEVHSDFDESTPLSAAVDLTAYRITQEALTNITKHAPESKARVDIRQEDGMLNVEVVNELAAAPESADHGGMGLLNMRERAVAVGGSFTAGPGASGWHVRAALPISGVRA
ncbi:sensor histidine kinase [Amycolatopsis antarctica]|uniref:sensor histidine kinase n=1 Tax=Amycolatopsis antarctica TaxID=1854586 RepID=UPI001F0A31BB|nr:histidine kinase [Amycolatopsis antarctica]